MIKDNKEKFYKMNLPMNEMLWGSMSSTGGVGIGAWLTLVLGGGVGAKEGGDVL